MDLWNKITGTVTVELTAADPERILGVIAGKDIPMWEVKRPSVLVVNLRIQRSDLPQVKKITSACGGTLRILGLSGLYYKVSQWRKRPLLMAVILVLLAASIYLPGRILFVQVVGNETVPTRLIQETAAQFGLQFGASRRAVRSERIKNELLGAIEELEWVGVNTSGCTAVITVRERQVEPEAEEEKICDLVACTDGIIDSIILTKGTLMCAQGQAVQEGDILVSGYKDLGICTRAVEAQAEVYALTRRENQAVLPETTLQRGEQGDTKTYFSLIFGKKRINLYSDSGILPSTCGKMTQEISLRLPGGLTLPVKLVIQRCTEYEVQSAARIEEQALEDLTNASSRHLLTQTVAGQILTRRDRLELADGRWVFHGSYQCREMIARQSREAKLEGDTKDDTEDSERGAG